MTTSTTKPTLRLVQDSVQTSKTRREQQYSARGQVGRHMSRAQALKQQIDQLNSELSEERNWILDHMESRGLDRIESGDFQVQRRVSHRWTYSPALEREMLNIKASQKWEQSHGQAMDSPTASVAFVIKRPKS